jgi:hypothetical protein
MAYLELSPAIAAFVHDPRSLNSQAMRSHRQSAQVPLRQRGWHGDPCRLRLLYIESLKGADEGLSRGLAWRILLAAWKSTVNSPHTLSRPAAPSARNLRCPDIGTFRSPHPVERSTGCF